VSPAASGNGDTNWSGSSSIVVSAAPRYRRTAVNEEAICRRIVYERDREIALATPKGAVNAKSQDHVGVFVVCSQGEGRSLCPSDLYHVLRLMALWRCGRRGCVVQAQR
jgi:hypothetical protein